MFLWDDKDAPNRSGLPAYTNALLSWGKVCVEANLSGQLCRRRPLVLILLISRRPQADVLYEYFEF